MSFTDYVLSTNRFLETVRRDHVIPVAVERSINAKFGPDAQSLYVEYDIGNSSCIIQWLSKEASVILRVDNDSVKCVIGSLRSHSFHVYEGEWEKAGVCNEVIDLDSTGRRWEGSVKNGMPFGYGVIYDEEGRKEYESFVMDGKKTCYGIEYDSDIDQPIYAGCYLNDERFGRGIAYDRNGNSEYDGVWKHGEPYSPEFDGTIVNTYTNAVSIPDNAFEKVESFVLHRYFHSLNRIVVGNDCFKDTPLFDLSELTQLRSLEIGSDCCSFIKPLYDLNGVFRCSHCRQLRSIRIGNRSFYSYSSIELSDLPSLQSVTIGDNCFGDCSSFSLTGLVC